MKVKIYSVNDVLQELQYCIAYKRPFSHIRFGDGGLKMMRAFLEKDGKHLEMMCEKEGIPLSKIGQVLYLWTKYANCANFIDSPEVYFNGTFWPRFRGYNKELSKRTDRLLKCWKEYYDRMGIKNERYCNPESNHLFLVDNGPRTFNIFNVMNTRKFCIICPRPEIKDILREYNYNVDVYQIVGQYEDHYENCFRPTIKFITENATAYDFWMVAAGELGRIYSGHIKSCGGRVLDMGFAIDFWCGSSLHPRMARFLLRKGINESKLRLYFTRDGRKFSNMKVVLGRKGGRRP